MTKKENKSFNKTYSLRRGKGFIPSIALAALLILFTSCSDILTQSLQVVDTPQTERTITISGSVSDYTKVQAGAYPEELFKDMGSSDAEPNQSKLALPTLEEGESQYYVKATASGQPERSGTVEGNTFTIPLALGHVWTIELGLQTQEDGEDAPTTKLKAKYTYDQALTETDIGTTIHLTLTPTQTGYGKIDLGMPATGTLYDAFEVIVISGPEGGPSSSNFTTSTSSIENTNIKSGTYAVTIVFKKSGFEVYSSDQIINVYDNLTTNKWYADVSNTGTNNFNLTSEMISSYAKKNFYVASTTHTTPGSDSTGTGSSRKPFATVSKAIAAIEAQGISQNYTIRILSDIEDNISIDNDTLSADHVAGLTIKGQGGQKKLINKDTEAESSIIIKINTTIPITIENLEIRNTDDAYNTDKTCVGIKTEVASQTTNVNNCKITKTTATNGSAVYSGGKTILNHCEISGNSSILNVGYCIYNTNTLKMNNCTIKDNITNIKSAIYTSTQFLYLGGDTYIESPNGTAAIYLSGSNNTLKLESDFTSSGSKPIVLDTSETGYSAERRVLSAASGTLSDETAVRKFTMLNSNFSITSYGTDIGKLAVNPSYYVASTSSDPAGNDTSGNGSEAAPYATIGKALTTIKSLAANSPYNYRIIVSGEINEAITLSAGETSATLGSFTGSTLTIHGTDKTSDKLVGTNLSSLLTISCTNNVTLENLTITGLSSSTAPAVKINEGANVTIKNCKISDNIYSDTAATATAGIYNLGTLSLENVSVQNNKISNSSSSANGAGIYNNGTLNILGSINVTGNTKGTGSSEKSNNIYLPSDKIITVTGALEAESRIGVTTVMPNPGTPLVFTNDLRDHNQDIAVDTVFSSDIGYAVRLDTEENAGKATLLSSGGGIGTSFDYNVSLSSTNTTIAPSGVLTISANVTNNGEVVTVSAEDITWAFTLLCYGDPVPLGNGVSGTIPASNIVAEAGCARVTIPSTAQIFNGIDYTLHVSASFHGVAYDANISLTGAAGLPSSSYNELDEAPENVSVSGATYVNFGLWPQTIKANGVTVDENNAICVGGFIYYKGSDNAWYVKAAENANTNPNSNHTYSDGTTANQGGSSYKYFKVEPILWRVVNDQPSSGKKTLIAEKALTAIQYYDDEENRGNIKACFYDHSRIRAFLNGIEYNKQGTTSEEFKKKGFLQTAFTSDEQALIQVTPVDNTSGILDGYHELDADTNDKVFLLSNSELESSYGFTNNTRLRPLSDLAIANGAFVTKVTENGIEIRRGSWWTRTPGQNDDANAKRVDTSGQIGTGMVDSFYGVVPVLVLNN